jgi:hypothetical protein
MGDSNIRSESVNVEHIMQQIRARIREKRGADYTEQQIRDLAAAAFERFLDPRGARPELLEAFRQGRIPAGENYSFEDTTLVDSHRAPLRWIRGLLRPVLKLLFNPNPLIHALHLQSAINARNAESARMTYELLYNLVLETTRLSVELKAVEMRVESAATRLDFAERRARAVEGRLQQQSEHAQPESPSRSRGGQARTAPLPAAPARDGAAGSGIGQAGRDGDRAGGSDARRRKRRRRGRRGGAARPGGEAVPGVADGSADAGTDATVSHDGGPSGDAARSAETGGGHDEPTGREAEAAAPPPTDREDQ